MKKTLLSLMIALTSFGFASQALGARIHNPKYNGYGLDWCRNFESACGAPAADLYCQKRGYSGTTGFEIRHSVNFQTMTVGQNAICNPASHRCDSFKYVDCAETTKTFVKPKHNGYRLDWCKNFEGNCGAPAAQAYCQKKGFNQVVNFQKQNSLNVPTMTIGSNAICNPQYHVCDSFSSIECKK